MTNLTVFEAQAFNIDTTICIGETYFVQGELQNTSGVYMDSLMSVQGCDSIISTNLTVFGVQAFNVDTSICEGSTYFAQGALQDTSGVYMDSLISVLGCDSVVITNLTVLGAQVFMIDTAICDGSTYFAQGALQNTSGMYVDSLVSVLGCDSIITTNLTVLEEAVTNTELALTICAGETYFAQGALQNTSGVYVDSLMSTQGCDSIITTNLTVLEEAGTNTELALTICAGETHFAQGALQNTSGVYVDSLMSMLGCDSIITTNLTVFGEQAFNIDTTICEGSTYFAQGTVQTQAGQYVDTLLTLQNCDSIVITNLILEDCTNNTPCNATMPTAFSPNKDGFNDVYGLVANCGIQNYKLYIYNRWGELVFKSTDFTNRWDGSHKGKSCSIGTYVWQSQYEIIDRDGNILPFEEKGNVTLIR